jgi:hypothetical protein
MARSLAQNRVNWKAPSGHELGQPMIFIFSLARSGSTWLGKIFDTHPNVLYLHEPDIADRGLDLLPYWFEGVPDESHVEAALKYLKRLTENRSPRATGMRPFFHKAYRRTASEYFRRAVIYGAKGIESATTQAISNAIQIPDLASDGHRKRLVLKSVSALGRAEAFLRARGSEVEPILLLRDPRAFVSSLLRGKKLGVMERSSELGDLLRTRSARLIRIDESFRPKDDIEAYAWIWLLANMEANAAIETYGGTRVKYEVLAHNPEKEARCLFAQMNLAWSRATREFLDYSAQGEGEFYSLLRNPEVTAKRWRSDLSSDAVARINSVVSRHEIGRSYVDE